MLWLVIRLPVAMLVLKCLVHCAVPNPTLRESPPIAKEQSHSESKSTSKTILPNTASKQPTTPTVKTTRKETTKKTTAPALVDEFSLEEILFKGRQSNEANAFLKANEQRGKELETTYEQIREQDLNDLEALVKRRKQMRFSRSLKRLI